MLYGFWLPIIAKLHLKPRHLNKQAEPLLYYFIWLQALMTLPILNVNLLPEQQRKYFVPQNHHMNIRGVHTSFSGRLKHFLEMQIALAT